MVSGKLGLKVNHGSLQTYRKVTFVQTVKYTIKRNRKTLVSVTLGFSFGFFFTFMELQFHIYKVGRWVAGSAVVQL